MCYPFEWSSCKNSFTWSRILSSGSSRSIHMSTIYPFSLSISFKTRWVITIRACLRTWFDSSWRSLKISSVLSFKLFGNLLKRSPSEMIMFAFIPKSIHESRISKINFKLSIHMTDETHINLQSARIADLSKIHISGDYC